MSAAKRVRRWIRMTAEQAATLIVQHLIGPV